MDAALLRAVTALGKLDSRELEPLIAAMEKRLVALKTLHMLVSHLEQKNCLRPLGDLLQDAGLIDSELSAETPTLVDQNRGELAPRTERRRKRTYFEIRALILQILEEHGPLTAYQIGKAGELAIDTVKGHIEALPTMIFRNEQSNTYELKPGASPDQAFQIKTA